MSLDRANKHQTKTKQQTKNKPEKHWANCLWCGWRERKPPQNLISQLRITQRSIETRGAIAAARSIALAKHCTCNQSGVAADVQKFFLSANWFAVLIGKNDVVFKNDVIANRDLTRKATALGGNPNVAGFIIPIP